MKLSITLFFSLILTACLFSGCITLPGNPEEGVDEYELPADDQPSEPAPYEMPPEEFPPEGMPGDVPIEEAITPEPIPTEPLSNVSDWNAYEVLLYPEIEGVRPSILKNDTTHSRIHLNVTSSGTVALEGYAIGKQLNITHGPFSITFSVHPKIESPLNVWAKITVYDPWQNVIAEEGYNRGYTNEATKTFTVYRTGNYYMSMEGDFATMDYIISTGDPAPYVEEDITTEEEMTEEEIWENIR